jgi:hypothetical protein
MGSGGVVLVIAIKGYSLDGRRWGDWEYCLYT